METLMSDDRQNFPKSPHLSGNGIRLFEGLQPMETLMFVGRQNSQKPRLFAGTASDYLQVSVTSGDFNVQYSPK